MSKGISETISGGNRDKTVHQLQTFREAALHSDIDDAWYREAQRIFR